jgi:hypothetical protein
VRRSNSSRTAHLLGSGWIDRTTCAENRAAAYAPDPPADGRSRPLDNTARAAERS